MIIHLKFLALKLIQNIYAVHLSSHSLLWKLVWTIHSFSASRIKCLWKRCPLHRTRLPRKESQLLLQCCHKTHKQAESSVSSFGQRESAIPLPRTQSWSPWLRCTKVMPLATGEGSATTECNDGVHIAVCHVCVRVCVRAHSAVCPR
jgi:hypothetical protein